MQKLTEQNIRKVSDNIIAAEIRGERPEGVYFFGSSKKAIMAEFIRCEMRKYINEDVYSIINASAGVLKKFKEEVEDFDEYKLFFYEDAQLGCIEDDGEKIPFRYNESKLEEVVLEEWIFE